MENRILEILHNLRYWENCPDDYKKDIETFLNQDANKQLILRGDVSNIRKQLIDFERWRRVQGFFANATATFKIVDEYLEIIDR